MRFASKILLLTILILCPKSIAAADETLSTIQTMADKDVLAVAYVDLGSIDVKDCFEWAVKQQIIPPEAAKRIKPMTMMARGMLDQVKEAGADHLIALIKQDDLTMQRPPLFVISISKGKSAKEAIQTLQQAASMLQIRDFQMEVWNNSILAGSAEQIARAKAAPSVDRPLLTKAWKTFGGHDVGAIAVGSPDTRRVVRELFPKMQPPFEKITGKMIADQLVSGGLAIKLPTDTHAKIVAQTKDPESAKILCEAAIAGKKVLTAQDSQSFPMGLSLLARAAANLEPKVVGNDAVIDLDPLLNNEVKLMELLEPIRESARETQRRNNLRQVILAMHNYESAYRSFPARLSVDDNGKPLLSWRVHILPFLNEAELHQKFKLDEPWDSPNNIKLVKEMPQIYGDPSSRSGGIDDAGKTRYLVPVGADTVFAGVEGTKIQSVTDGTSNTIAVVRAVTDAAVVWTKPADWDVDSSNPKQGLFSKEGRQSIVARCDGAVTVVDSNISDETLKAALTKSGGEVVDF
jgi:hypothetical protein